MRIGRLRTRLPVAWYTAFATAAFMPAVPSSPIPLIPNGFTWWSSSGTKITSTVPIMLPRPLSCNHRFITVSTSPSQDRSSFPRHPSWSLAHRLPRHAFDRTWESADRIVASHCWALVSPDDKILHRLYQWDIDKLSSSLYPIAATALALTPD